jgi:hypothetical protein
MLSKLYKESPPIFRRALYFMDGMVTAGFEVLKSFFGDSNTIELHTTTAGEPEEPFILLAKGKVRMNGAGIVVESITRLTILHLIIWEGRLRPGRWKKVQSEKRNDLVT